MTLAQFTTLLLIGATGSFISGMLGIGGSIVKYPMLLYIPSALGIAAFSAHEVAGISAIQVLFAAGSGVLAYRKGNFLHAQLILVMGSAILVGSLLGAAGAKFLSETAINVIYGVLATAAAFMMLWSNKSVRSDSETSVPFNPTIAAVSSFIVGLLSGVVGAAGAFILVPIMLVILHIPTRVAIASSLAITFISSIGTSLGKLYTGGVLFGPALIMAWASIVFAPLGARLSKHVNTKWLRLMLAILIVATSIKIWSDVLVK